ncbi:MAG: hypothetical protein FWH05_00210 [Oscillospiraceae bacterium]|nr:hypothetical protein [Oscillospiraceae bacterium]
MQVEIISAIISSVSVIIAATLIPTIKILNEVHINKRRNKSVLEFKTQLEKTKEHLEKLASGDGTFSEKFVNEFTEKYDELCEKYNVLKENGCGEHEKIFKIWIDLYSKVSSFFEQCTVFGDALEKSESQPQILDIELNEMMKTSNNLLGSLRYFSHYYGVNIIQKK